MSQAERWTEFEDRTIVDYKRVRTQIEHEDELVNQRMTWLLTSNGFLFTAFALALSAITKAVADPAMLKLANWMFTIFPLLGLLICYIAARVIDAALCQIKALHIWWDTRPQLNLKEHPPLIGIEGISHHRRLLALGVPALLAVAWIGMLVGFHQLLLQEVLPKIVEPALAAFALVGAFILGWYARSRKQTTVPPVKGMNSSPNPGPQPDGTAGAAPRG